MEPTQTPTPFNSAETTVTAVSPATSSPIEVAALPPKQRKIKIFAIIFACLTVLIGGGGLAYILLSGDDTDTAKKHDIAHIQIDLLSGYDLSLAYPKRTAESEQDVVMSNQVFEALVKYQDFTKIVPSLSTGWSNPNTSTWVFNLKQGVKFHNGRVMQASDVVASIEALQQQQSIYVQTIDKVTSVGAHTVKITTKGPDPILLNRLAYAFIYDAKSATKNSPSNGTGPYMLKPGGSNNSKRIDLSAFDGYHGGHVYTRSITYEQRSDDDIAKDIKNNRMDFSADLQKDQLAFAPKTSKLVPASTDSVGLMGASMIKTGPINDLRVRQAIVLALDKSDIIKQSSLIAQPVSQLVPSQVPGYNQDIKPVSRDITKAKDLLKQAGYPNGVSLSLAYVSDKKGPETVQKNLAEAGIRTTMNEYDDFDKFIDDVGAGKPDLYIAGYSSSFADGSDFFDAIVSGFSNYKNPEYLSLVSEANSDFDAAKRLSELQSISKNVSDNAVVMPLYIRNGQSLMMHKNYVAKQEISGSSGSIYWWKVYAEN